MDKRLRTLRLMQAKEQKQLLITNSAELTEWQQKIEENVRKVTRSIYANA